MMNPVNVALGRPRLLSITMILSWFASSCFAVRISGITLKTSYRTSPTRVLS